MRAENVWWLMLGKDKERGERKRTSTDRGGRQRGDRLSERQAAKKQGEEEQAEIDRQTGNKQTERWGKGETDGGSQRTSCYVAKMDYFTSFGIVCTGLFDCAELKSYDISTQITCV